MNVATIVPLTPVAPRQPKPEWLKVRAPGSPRYLRLKALMRELSLHTVCEEAQCPNIGECWNHGTATFMILGHVCTRACAYCAVSHGRPSALDAAEPARVADAIKTLELNYVVITSVDRDDLPDGGASIFAETIRETRRRLPECRHRLLSVPLRYRGLPVPTRRFVAAARRLGCPVHVWTVNDAATARRLWARGVAGVVTDVPDVIRAAGRG